MCSNNEEALLLVSLYAEAVLGYNLTEIKGFNSHLHGIPESLPTNILPKQVTYIKLYFNLSLAKLKTIRGLILLSQFSSAP